VAEATPRTAPPTDADREAPAATPDDAAKAPGKRLLDWPGAKVLLSPFAEIGALARLLGESFYWGVRPPFRFKLFFEASEFIGVGSIFIVGLTGLFVGMVMGLQLVDGFREFGAENQTGAVIGLGMSREIGPVFAALMVSSRAGSAITTEIGSMRVTSQIDALETMAVSPVQYLVVPRLFGGFVMVPVLTMLFNIIGMFGAWFVSVKLMGIDPGIFMDRMAWLVDWEDVFHGLIKAAVFGFTVCLIACRQGYYASGGAAGVGRATNRSVVHAAIAILAEDYVITSILIGDGL
jgi:phospholipid/cholesterol/gamma-HCH transport system permease protein